MKRGFTARFLAFLCAIALTYSSVLFPTAQLVFADPSDVAEETVTQEEPVVAEEPAEEPQQQEPAVQQEPVQTTAPEQPVAETEPVQEPQEPEETAVAEPEKGTEPVETPEEAQQTEEPVETPEEVQQTEEPVLSGEEEQEETEIRMPAQSFRQTYGELQITVEAPEGALPEGATMVVAAAGSNVASSAEAAYGDLFSEVFAAKIQFQDKDGNTVLPEEKIQVTLQATASNPEASYEAVRIKKDGSFDTLESAAVTGAKAKFEVKDFTVLGLVELIEKTEEPSEEVTEEPQEAEEDLPQEEEPVEEELEEEEELTEEETVDPMTAKTFSGNAGNISVFVQAPEGAFPAGTSMVLRPVSESSVIDQIAGSIDQNVKSVQAVDISFRNTEGTEIEPLLPIRVMLGSALISSDAVIVHMDDNGGVEQMDAAVRGTSATFRSNDFSIYAVVETGEDARLEVEFVVNGTAIMTTNVKKSDLEAGSDGIVHFSDIVYDPGTGELASGVMFRGWTTDASYTPETEGLDIDGVRGEITTMLNAGVTDGQKVTYYAILLKAYHVSYLDERGASLGSAEVRFRADDAAAYQKYVVDMFYQPEDDEHNFEGWLVSEGSSNIQDYAANANYPNGTQIMIKGDVTFSVNAPEGHWLVFNENGKGATYNAPQFVKSNEVTTEPTLEMVRSGYTFGGWYTNAECTGNAFTFGGTITDLTNLYAKWTPIATANYTVLIWKQKVSGVGYDFEESITLTGTVGTNVNTVSANGNGNNRYARVNGVNKQYTGFHLKEYDQKIGRAHV